MGNVSEQRFLGVTLSEVLGSEWLACQRLAGIAGLVARLGGRCEASPGIGYGWLGLELVRAGLAGMWLAGLLGARVGWG